MRCAILLILPFIISCYVGELGPESPPEPPQERECTEAIPGTKSHQKAVQGFYDPTETSFVMRMFAANWIRYFGHDEEALNDTLNKLCLMWEENIIEKNYDDGRTVLYSGFTTVDRTWVYIGNLDENNERKIYETALVHELVHNALYYHNGDLDSDHSGDKSYGWSSLHDEFIRDTIEGIRFLMIPYEDKQR